MEIINLNITPIPVQAFQLSLQLNPGTYVLIAGQVDKKIRLNSFNITSTAGKAIIQDSKGLILATINGSYGSNGSIELTSGADLQLFVSENTVVNCCFIGFIS